MPPARPVRRLSRSLQGRLLAAASLVLLAFLGLTGLSLDNAFRRSAMLAVQERLQAHVYTLLAVAELGSGGGLRMPDGLPEARFAIPLSGLYAGIGDQDGASLWQSRSMLGRALPQVHHGGAPGQPWFDLDPNGGSFVLSFTVDWEYAPETYRRLLFWVAEERSAFDAQLRGFRRNLWGWLLGSAMLLLFVQGAILRWGLQPLHRLARQVDAVRRGEQDSLHGIVPAELEPLSEGLNQLLGERQKRLDRYRHALGDLAHSLKTPLAVLDGTLHTTDADQLRAAVHEQVARMNRTIEYQLQRAAASGRESLARPIPLEPVVARVVRALQKVYQDRRLEITVQADTDLMFPGEEGDWFEIVGNLADNACKWAQARVWIRARAERDPEGILRFRLEVEDDGPGVPAGERSRILERGARADPAVAGHGIGLAVVRDLVEDAYGGRLEILAGAAGGALVRITLRGAE